MKTKLLIVDDRRENLFALSTLLDEFGAEVHTAESGAAALELMNQHEYALAILDIQMPDIDGFRLAEMMRGNERTKNVPIIFITSASENTGFAFRGYESGAVDILYKPIDAAVLRSKVRVFIEMDEQRHALQSAKDAAEAANKLKSAFLANMSHEIRTPLGAMIGFAEMLEDPAVPAEDKLEYSRIIRKNGQLLLRLIDDVLDLSKVEAGQLQAEMLQFSPEGLANEVLDLLRRVAEKKGVALELDLAPNLPRLVVSDPTRVRQILMNIVGNAIKFTRQGEVRVTLGFDQTGAYPLLRLIVEDTGVGIEESVVARLFQSFVQADHSTTRRFGGTGLGLILSKRLAQGLGGDVRLTRSQIQKGSAFEITVRAQPLDAAPLAERKASPVTTPSTPKPLDGMRILVAEDSEDNQTLIRLILNRYGAEVEFANDGVEAVEKALKGRHDVVLMDIQMPALDGYGATRKLRAEGYSSPIIALTAHAMTEERDRCIEAGCTDHLSKPIDRAVLLQKLSALKTPRGT